MMNSSSQVSTYATSAAANYGAQASDSYTDLSSLNAIRDLGRENKNQALEQVAKQFESMMTRMMMKSMRSANEVFAEGNYLSSHEGDMYQEMFDDQMALSLSQGRGLGIAEVMVRQLKGRFGESDKSLKSAGLNQYLANRHTAKADVVGLTTAKAEAQETNQQLAKNASKPMLFDGSSEKFIEYLYPMAEKAAKKLGVEPEFLLAQAALETGWGKKVTGLGEKTSFNFFNIKADQRWQGSTVTVPTLEIKNGVAVKEIAAFRAYSSPEQSFNDYAEFISQSPRYQQALQAENSEQYIQSLEAAGYATDPNYSEKIIRIINSTDFTAAGNVNKPAQLAMVGE
ncbi:flagellar assembly peptidoglycan hydrolase FlgJ [Oceanicoccus sp. KOV_DT_Chl]|uniref:flagellar assembly peptidoglycan hydrolase FlgJ n=1 Tax=Oceanicoccus sp. KOV_DT_Chl TaxID=1904639 RepID=UPI00190E61EB|nr:flagellar assembly peptidoglycan hydrolase FlgJ [Oceanicoccus sp. KOV_DT_Chl]